MVGCVHEKRNDIGSGYWPSKMVYSQGCSNNLRSDENRRFGHGFGLLNVCLMYFQTKTADSVIVQSISYV